MSEVLFRFALVGTQTSTAGSAPLALQKELLLVSTHFGRHVAAIRSGSLLQAHRRQVTDAMEGRMGMLPRYHWTIRHDAPAKASEILPLTTKLTTGERARMLARRGATLGTRLKVPLRVSGHVENSNDLQQHEGRPPNRRERGIVDGTPAPCNRNAEVIDPFLTCG